MSEPTPPVTPGNPSGFPDVDDPIALAAWLDSIEESAGRISERQALVLEMASASHEIFMLKTQYLPVWATRADYRRAWGVVGAGLLLSVTTTVALDRLNPDDTFVLVPCAIACIVWFFVAAHEVARTLRYRSKVHAIRDEQVLEVTQRRDAAAALLDKANTDRPTSGQ